MSQILFSCATRHLKAQRCLRAGADRANPRAETDQLLRDMAFAYHLAGRVKEAITGEKTAAVAVS